MHDAPRVPVLPPFVQPGPAATEAGIGTTGHPSEGPASSAGTTTGGASPSVPPQPFVPPSLRSVEETPRPEAVAEPLGQGTVDSGAEPMAGQPMAEPMAGPETGPPPEPEAASTEPADDLPWIDAFVEEPGAAAGAPAGAASPAPTAQAPDAPGDAHDTAADPVAEHQPDASDEANEDADPDAWPMADEASRELDGLLPAVAAAAEAGGDPHEVPDGASHGGEAHADTDAKPWQDDEPWMDDIMPALPSARPDGEAEVAWAHAFGAAVPASEGADGSDGTDRASGGTDGSGEAGQAEAWQGAPASVDAPGAPSADAEQLAARLVHLSERVRRGEVVPEGPAPARSDTALLAGLLAALLQRDG